ncbi:MAG: hypothetical protein IPL54_14000 [Chitinophagaceae bacterium]|nr:hypothetical protein [Chitinophagaceae bacterium]
MVKKIQKKTKKHESNYLCRHRPVFCRHSLWRSRLLQQQKNGELKKLYVEEKLPPPVPTVEEKTVEVIPVKNVETTPSETKVVKAKVKSPKKVKKVKKTIRFENFSRGRIKEPVVMEEKIVEKKN